MPSGFSGRGSNPAADGFAITKNDSTDLAVQPRGIYVGGAGDVAVVLGAATVTFVGAVAGSILPIAPSRVMSTGTTATNLLGLY